MYFYRLHNMEFKAVYFTEWPLSPNTKSSVVLTPVLYRPSSASLIYLWNNLQSKALKSRADLGGGCTPWCPSPSPLGTRIFTYLRYKNAITCLCILAEIIAYMYDIVCILVLD